MHFGIEPINTRKSNFPAEIGPNVNISCYSLITGIAWVLTREQHPTNSTIDAALAVLNKNGIDQSKLRLMNQHNC